MGCCMDIGVMGGLAVRIWWVLRPFYPAARLLVEPMSGEDGKTSCLSGLTVRNCESVLPLGKYRIRESWMLL